ncbi:hypothetical protein HDU86_008404 [Geranomyces michiganensis]|nr:hypothetical protein HDU86_008404 [Geranomyces michiganensis]
MKLVKDKVPSVTDWLAEDHTRSWDEFLNEIAKDERRVRGCSDKTHTQRGAIRDVLDRLQKLKTVLLWARTRSYTQAYLRSKIAQAFDVRQTTAQSLLVGSENERTILAVAFPKRKHCETSGDNSTNSAKRNRSCSPSPPRPSGMQKETPIRKLTGIPAVHASPSPWDDSGSELSELGDDTRPCQKASIDLARNAVAALVNRDQTEDCILTSINLHNVLVAMQKRIIKKNIAIQKSNPFLYLAARSCLLLSDTFPAELKGIIEPAAYASLRLLFTQKWGFNLAEPEPVSGKNVPALAKTDKKLKSSGAKAEHITPLEPSKTSEPDWTRKFVFPFFGLLRGANLETAFDCRTEVGPKRPDMRIFTNKGRHTRCLLVCEAKTKWANAAEISKETSRVIERVMEAFRAEVGYFHADRSPKLAMSIAGV